MSLGYIIRQKREKLHLTLDEVSKKAGFSKPYLSTIETEKVKNPPSDELLKKLEEILDFEQGLLRHIAHMERMPADIRHEYESSAAENKRWRVFARNLIHDRDDSEEIGGLLAESDLNSEPEEVPLKAGQLVPVINRVSAGYPVDFDDMDYPAGIADDYVRCPDIHDSNAFAVRVVGDSMEPKFWAGNIVVFSPATEVNNGDDCFVRFKMPHETTFKRVYFEDDGKVRLQPRNEKYSPLIVDGERINGLYRAVIKYEKL